MHESLGAARKENKPAMGKFPEIHGFEPLNALAT